MAQPLAERMRPKTLDEYIGQKHLVGEGAVLRRMIEAGRGADFFVYFVGTAGSRKDHPGADCSEPAGSSFLYTECGYFGSEGSA